MNMRKEEGRAPCAETTASELIECGRASKETRGMANLPSFELGFPPYDRTFPGEEDEPS